MSMYSLIFGDGKPGLTLLLALGFKRVGDVGRYRDAWLERGPDGKGRIAVYTRNGGGNRECWGVDCKGLCPGCRMRELAKHPLYLFDEDDEFDCTYATIYFRPPEQYESTMAQTLAEAEKQGLDTSPVDMSKRWTQAIDEFERLFGESDA